MSWLFSRALVEAYSEGISLDGAPSAPSSETPTPLAYCAPDKMMAFCRLSRFGTTFAPLTDDRGEAVLTWFLGVSHAKTLALQEKEPVSPEHAADCGDKWRELSVKFDRVSSSWKTARCLFDEALPWSSVTLPRWGMMRDGVCWERITPELATSEIAFGFWPTPTAGDAKGSGSRNTVCSKAHAGISLTDAVRGDGGTGRTVAGGPLNPTWVEWLMGWPLGWTALEPLETDKYQRWLLSHGSY